MRSSCVGPRPPETATRSASATASRSVRSSSVRVVADDVDPRGLEPDGEQRAGQERAVQVGSLAADELAARDDDDGAGPSRAQAWSAGDTLFAVTNTPRPLHGRSGAHAIPVHLHDHVLRRADVEPERLAREALLLASFDGSVVDGFLPSRTARGGPPRTSRPPPPRISSRAVPSGPAACLASRLRRRRLQPAHAGVLGAAEAPRGDHERGEDADQRQREQHDARLAPLALPASRRRHAPRPHRDLVLADDEPGVVLVHVELPVEAERVGVGAEEALDVGVRREQLEALVLERAEVLRADLRRVLELREVEALAQARLPEAVSDLEHAGILAALFLHAQVPDPLARIRNAQNP